MREVYPGQLVQLANGDAAPNLAFSIWDDLVAGNNVTGQLIDLDNVSAFTPVTNSQGLIEHFRGPDEYRLPLFVDSGAGQRAMLLPATVWAALVTMLTSGVTTDAVAAVVAGMFSGPQGTGVSVAFDPGAKKLTIAVTGAGGGTGGSVSWDTLSGKPTTFPPTSHTHPVSQVSDASDVGKAVMKAADAAAARTAIGAGTGNGTSNLTIGTTGSTAAPGNHAHAASAVTFTPAGSLTATDVQAAIQQAATMGGGGSGTGVQRRNASESARGYPTTTPLDIFDDRGTGVPPTWYQPGLDVLLSAV